MGEKIEVLCKNNLILYHYLLSNVELIGYEISWILIGSMSISSLRRVNCARTDERRDEVSFFIYCHIF